MPGPCLERFAARPLTIVEGARHDRRETTVVLGERRQAVERPRPYQFLPVLDIPTEDHDHALPFPGHPAKKRQGPDDLKSDLPFVAVRETADEQLLWGVTQSECSWAIFSSRSIARIDTSQSGSSASEASSATRSGVVHTSASTCFDCAIDRRSPPESNPLSACCPRIDPCSSPTGTCRSLFHRKGNGPALAPSSPCATENCGVSSACTRSSRLLTNAA